MNTRPAPKLTATPRLVTYVAVRPGPTPIRIGRTSCTVPGSGTIEERQGA